MRASVLAHQTKPAWNQVDATPQFLIEKGFSFEVDKLPKHLNEQKTVELIVVIPETFIHIGATNTFENLLLLHNELGVDICTWPHEGKKRAIITISEKMAQKTELYFYYKNKNEATTEGTQFVIKIPTILKSIETEKAQPSAGGYGREDAAKPQR